MLSYFVTATPINGVVGAGFLLITNIASIITNTIIITNIATTNTKLQLQIGTSPDDTVATYTGK